MSDRPASTQTVWTVARLLDWTRSHFEHHSLDEPRLAAEILLAHALGCKRIELYTRFDRVPEPEKLAAFRELVKKAAAHAPIAYLVGVKEFFSLNFEVTPAVLIPRPETELLVEAIIDHHRQDEGSLSTLLDIGTGSGCIVVAALKYVPNLRAVAGDVSTDALAVAARNAEAHEVADRVTFVEADSLSIPQEFVPSGGFDAIVSNPPYVAAEEMATLEATVRDYEPHTALTDGADGLSFFRQIATGGADLLTSDGTVFVEVADGQAQAVREIFAASGRFEAVACRRDGGGHDRVLSFRRTG